MRGSSISTTPSERCLETWEWLYRRLRLVTHHIVTLGRCDDAECLGFLRALWVHFVQIVYI